MGLTTFALLSTGFEVLKDVFGESNWRTHPGPECVTDCLGSGRVSTLLVCRVNLHNQLLWDTNVDVRQIIVGAHT